MQPLSSLNSIKVYTIITVLAVAVFLFFCTGLFFYDEDIFVINTNGAFMQHAWQRSVLPKLFFRLQSIFFEANAVGYHIVSVVLHLCCAFAAAATTKSLLLSLINTVEAEQVQRLVLLFFILFLFSPIHSEPLCYILAQGVLLATLFCLLSILFYLKAIQKNKKLSITSLLFFAAALLSYEISWLLPVIILCIAVYIGSTKKQSFKFGLKLSIYYFIILAFWLAVKTVFISKALVADYSSFSILNNNLLTVLRNMAVLMLRNFIPPFKSTNYFVGVGLCVVIATAAALIAVYKNNKSVFKILLLLIVLTILAFLPAAPFGIDSHDSESERYIYFSSVFALFFLALLLTTLIRQTKALLFIGTAIILIYIFSLYLTIGYYQKAAKFSKVSLNALNSHATGTSNFYLLNQPSQYKGALMFRAQSRLPFARHRQLTVLNEYMKSIFYNHNTKFITLTAQPVDIIATKLHVSTVSIDSLSNYYPSITIDKAMGKLKTDTSFYQFNINKAGVAALAKDTLYIFK